MKVTVKVKSNVVPIKIHTEYIKLQDAMKLAHITASGGEAKLLIQDGQVMVGEDVCFTRGKKLHPGDSFSYQGKTYRIEL